MSVCFGAMLMADVRLLDGLQAPTHHWGLADLEKAPQFEVVEAKRFIDSGKIFTSAGLAADIDGSLHIVERLLGKKAAQWTADELMEHYRK